MTIADDIEKARIPLAKKRVFSYRFKLNKGYIFNKHYTITNFKKMVADKSKRKKVKVIVSCDIANYYDRLNIHRLENTLFSINCDREKVKLINELLLFWSGRDSYGLPVGSNASRILAEANLIGVDNYLESMNIDFIRFVDDYRFFAPDAHTAHYWLTLLIDRLWQEGLTINMSKTKIEPSEKFVEKKVNVGSEETTERKGNNKSGKNDKNPFIIRAGYGGVIPTRFREPSRNERKKLENIDLNKALLIINNQELMEADKFIEIIRASIVQDNFSFLVQLMPMLDKYLQLSPYFVDVLIKYSHSLSKEEQNEVKNFFSNNLQNEQYLPEYLILAYIRILGHEDFKDKSILMNYFRNLRRNSGVYIGRSILDSLYNLVNREDVLEIRKGFNRADLWEKRQIIRIVDRVLDEEEKRPWLKNIKQIESNELFLQELANPTKKSIKRKKKTTYRLKG